MWLIILLSFGPFIYIIISCVIDSISDKAEEIRRERYHGEDEIAYFTTYKNDNISKEDLMLFFISQFKKYKQRYYNIEYKIFDAEKDQNYAWSIKTTKRTYGWGIIYNIQFNFSNGWIKLSFSNIEFLSGEKISSKYYLLGYDCGTTSIESALTVCRDEAKIIWKMNGMEPDENLPFNYIPLSENNKSSGKNTTQCDLLSFYRNLFGLKLRFSHDELKKSYREAVGKYHPDRYGTSSPRDRENAEMLMKQVNDAYNSLKEIAG
jgi:hypothetical protein